MSRQHSGRGVGAPSFLVALLALLLPLAALRSAAAQFGEGLFAPPISTEALERYLGRYVQPPESAHAAIEQAHERYLEAYRKLRDADLEPFEREKPPPMTGGSMAPWMKKMEQLRGKVISLDTSFFDAVRLAVPAEKQAGVERMRAVREVDVLGSGIGRQFTMGMMGGPGRVRVSELVFTSGLTAEDLAKADVVLREHEPRMLSASRKADDQSSKLFLELTEEMQKIGLWGSNLENAERDPAKMAEMAQQMQTLIQRTMTGMREAQAPIGELNRRSFRQVRDTLSPDGVVTVQRKWVQEGFPGMSGEWPREVETLVKRASKLDGFTAEQKQTLERLTQDFWRRYCGAIDSAETIEEQLGYARMSQMMSGQDPGQASGIQALEESRDKARDERRAMVESSMQAMMAVLTPEQAQAFNGAKQAGPDGGGVPDPELMAQAEEEEGETVVAPMPGSPVEGGMLPLQQWGSSGQISVGDVARICTALGLPEAERGTVESLHADYLKQWEEQVAPRAMEYAESDAKVWTQADGGIATIDSAMLDQAAARGRTLLTSAKTADGSFFDGIAAIATPDKADVLAWERLRRVSGLLGRQRSDRGGWFTQFGEQPVDVPSVLDAADLTDEQRAAARRAVLPMVTEMEAALIQAMEATLDANRDIMKLQGELQAAQRGTQEEQVAASQGYMKKMAAIQKRLRSGTAARTETQHKAMDAALAAMPAETRSRVRRLFSEQSFPEVFQDPRSLFAVVEKVAAMNDLTPAQKTQVAEVLAEYRQGYDLACDAMLAAAMTPFPEGDDEMNREYWLALQQRQRSIEQMRFERDETTARAAAKLRRVLNAEQLGRFPQLKAPAEKSEHRSLPF